MPTMGVRIVYAGNNSVAGHMYVVFKDDDGTITTYGHFPLTQSDATGGRGIVRRDDDKFAHEVRPGAPGTNGVPDVSRDFPISRSAFETALAFAIHAEAQRNDPTQQWGQYNPLFSSCVDFAWNVMAAAGLSGDSSFEGYLWPSWNK